MCFSTTVWTDGATVSLPPTAKLIVIWWHTIQTTAGTTEENDEPWSLFLATEDRKTEIKVKYVSYLLISNVWSSSAWRLSRSQGFKGMKEMRKQTEKEKCAEKMLCKQDNFYLSYLMFFPQWWFLYSSIKQWKDFIVRVLLFIMFYVILKILILYIIVSNKKREMKQTIVVATKFIASLLWWAYLSSSHSDFCHISGWILNSLLVCSQIFLFWYLLITEIHVLVFTLISWVLIPFTVPSINTGEKLLLHTLEQSSHRRDIMVEVHVLILATGLRYGRESSL